MVSGLRTSILFANDVVLLTPSGHDLWHAGEQFEDEHEAALLLGDQLFCIFQTKKRCLKELS